MTHSRGYDLVAHLADLRVEALPADVVVQAKGCLVDAVGCGIFGAEQEWTRILREEIVAEGAPGSATVFAAAGSFAAPAAALCNGTAIHAFELDDLIAESVVHPAAAVIPAALAAGEAVDASGERLLSGVVAGYEIMHRVGLALGFEPARRGFHKTSLVAPVAAAVAAGVTRGLPFEKLVAAVGLACSAASGIKSFAAGQGGGMVKRLHLGRAAEAGVRACQLAERGFTGPPHAIDGRFGLLEIYGGEGSDAEALTRGPGTGWAVGEVWFKVYPICGWIQPVVQLLMSLRGERQLALADIESVRIGVSSYAARNNGEPSPGDTMGAQYSIPFCAALALLGDPRDPRAFQGLALRDTAVRTLARRIEIVVDPDIEAVYPRQFGARVVLTMSGGERREDMVLDCHGTPADPCTEDEHLAKFGILASELLDVQAASRFAEQIAALETLSSIRNLTRLLKPAADIPARTPTRSTAH